MKICNNTPAISRFVYAQGIAFDIQFLDNQAMQRINKLVTPADMAESTGAEFQARIQDNILRAAIVGWSFTTAALYDLLEPSTGIDLEGTDPAAPFQFNPGHLDIIVAHGHHDLKKFLADAARDVRVHCAARKRVALENLPYTSAGAPTERG